MIDGHTHFESAKALDLEDIPVPEKEFDGEAAALEHAICVQTHRRDMTEAILLACIKTLDKIRDRGGERAAPRQDQKRQVTLLKNLRNPLPKSWVLLQVRLSVPVQYWPAPRHRQRLCPGKKTINRAFLESRAIACQLAILTIKASATA